MARTNRAFKKKKALGWHAEGNKTNSNLCPNSPSTSVQTPTSNDCSSQPKDIIASTVKFIQHLEEYKQFLNTQFEYNIVGIGTIQEPIQQVAVCHGWLCLSTSKKVDLALKLSLECLVCDIKAKKPGSPSTEVSLEDKVCSN